MHDGATLYGSTPGSVLSGYHCNQVSQRIQALMCARVMQAGGASFTALNKEVAVETAAGLPNFAIKLMKWLHDYGILFR